LAGGWWWFVPRELVAGGWFVLREKYRWLVADKPNQQGGCFHFLPLVHHRMHTLLSLVHFSFSFFFRQGRHNIYFRFDWGKIKRNIGP
jgi:hypothetical protein